MFRIVHKMKKITDEIQNYVFWQPFIITYAITIMLAFFICVVHYNISSPPVDTTFYQVSCPNYAVLFIAKIAETLVPTTITFALTLVVAEYKKIKQSSMGYTLFVVILVFLSLMGALFPIIKTLGWLWVYLTSVYGGIVFILIVLKKLLSNVSPGRTSKAEKSDGKF